MLTFLSSLAKGNAPDSGPVRQNVANRYTLLLLLFAASLPGQTDFRKHNVWIGTGAGLPREELRPYLTSSPALTFGYGYRPLANVQIESGLETIFGAADVQDFLETGFGPLRIRDYQFLVPMGGRLILPLSQEKVLVYGGGGGAYMRYSEQLSQPNQFYRFECPACASRSGWGWYALTGASVALDDARRFRLGGTLRNFQGTTEGFRIGQLPGIRTRDRWLVLTGEFTFSF